jgi:O-acetyl-ADP-ribose deacetylase (regulator of RNase III)
VFGYPIEEAAQIAMREVREFLAAKNARDTKKMEVIFCCFSEQDKRVYEEIDDLL